MRIGSKYYNVDCTWDGQDAATYNEFLLKSEADFRDHTRESWPVAGSHCLDYTSAEFNAQYPMTENHGMSRLHMRIARRPRQVL